MISSVIAEQRYDATQSYEQNLQSGVHWQRSWRVIQSFLQNVTLLKSCKKSQVFMLIGSQMKRYILEGKALKQIESLQKKHHLEQEDQFDDKLGQAVNRLVTDAMRGDQDRQQWKAKSSI